MQPGENANREESRSYQNPILIGVVLLIAGISVAMIQYKVPTILTELMALFAMDAKAASWLMSIFTLMSIFVALPAGWLAQKFGAKRMMIVACGIAVVGSLIGVASGSSAILIFSRAVEGIALTVLTTCGPIVVQKCVKPEKIGTSMGIWGIWGCLGSTIAAVMTPTVFEAVGFSGLWILFAAISACAAILVAVMIRVPKDGQEREPEVLERAALLSKSLDTERLLPRILPSSLLASPSSISVFWLSLHSFRLFCRCRGSIRRFQGLSVRLLCFCP